MPVSSGVGLIVFAATTELDVVQTEIEMNPSVTAPGSAAKRAEAPNRVTAQYIKGSISLPVRRTRIELKQICIRNCCVNRNVHTTPAPRGDSKA